MSKRELFSIETNREYIHGIVDFPETDRGLPAIIFLHGAGGYRTGPHDMLKNIAGELSRLGFPCIRFDFRGKGYSGPTGFISTSPTQKEDLRRVIGYAESHFSIRRFMLLGICSGAKLALHSVYSGSERAEGLILLSIESLRSGETSTQAVYRQVGMNFREYLRKAFSRNTWHKLFRNEINWGVIFRYITGPLKKISKKRKKPVPQVKSDRFPDFNGSVLLIFGGNDPETGEGLRQTEELLNKWRIAYDTHIIKGANHNFYSFEWEAELIGKCREWLEKYSGATA